jgi:hypothetical protein
VVGEVVGSLEPQRNVDAVRNVDWLILERTRNLRRARKQRTLQFAVWSGGFDQHGALPDAACPPPVASVDAAIPEEAVVFPSGRRFSALVDVLARAGVDLDLAYQLQLGRMEFESNAVPLDLPDRAVDIDAAYSEDSSMEEVIVAVPYTPQQTPRQTPHQTPRLTPRMEPGRRPSIAASALNRKFSAIPPPDSRGVWDASQQGRHQSIFSAPQTLELPLSAMQVRRDEVVDPSPRTPADALFGDGRSRKFSSSVARNGL